MQVFIDFCFNELDLDLCHPGNDLDTDRRADGVEITFLSDAPTIILEQFDRQAHSYQSHRHDP